MKRNNLSSRTKTHSGTFIDELEMSDTILDFAGTVRNMLQEYSILPEHAFNMDQTAVFFDSSPRKTINEKGSKSICIRSSSGVNGRVTVNLAVSFSGIKLVPLVIFKGVKGGRVANEWKNFNSGYCSRCVYSAQEKAWCDQQMMDIWISKCYAQHLKSIDQEPFRNLLLLDNFSVHKTNATHTTLAEFGTMVQMLPPNFTSKLQILDVGVNKPFKDRLTAIWMQWMVDNDKDTKITRAIISHWIADAWEAIPTSAIINTARRIGFTLE